MKLTKSRLKKLIREQLQVLNEAHAIQNWYKIAQNPNNPEHFKAIMALRKGAANIAGPNVDACKTCLKMLCEQGIDEAC